MPVPNEHPIVATLSEGIIGELTKVRNAGWYRAALILLYCGMDQVSYLAMPPDEQSGTRAAFARWVEKYMVLQGDTVLTGPELYAARCGMTHKYGTEAKLHLDGKILRQLGYVAGGPQKVYFDPKTPHLVLVEINYLIDAFIDGVLQFVRDLEVADASYQEAVNTRLHGMIFQFQIGEP